LNPAIFCLSLSQNQKDGLTKAPEKFGALLSNNLKNFWKLRIGDFRVVYQVFNKKLIVFVLAVGPRRDKEIYRTASRRI